MVFGSLRHGVFSLTVYNSLPSFNDKGTLPTFTTEIECQEQLGSECNVMKRAPRDTIHAFTFNQDLQALFQIL